jgi:hypothetical protein
LSPFGTECFNACIFAEQTYNTKYKLSYIH